MFQRGNWWRRSLTSFFKSPRRPYRRPASRPQPRSFGLLLERLEDRLAPAVTLTYGGPGTPLSLIENTSGSTPTITVSETSPNLLEINLNGKTFAAGSTTAATGLTYSTPGNPTASTSATIDISAQNNITTLTATLTGDTLDLGGIADTVGGLGNISASAGSVSVLASATVDTTHAAAGSGNLTLNAATTLVENTGATLLAKDGSITLTANQGAASGNFIGITINGATVKTTGAGAISLTGTGGSDSTTGTHLGILVEGGATVQSAGTGTITLQGTGGTGTAQNIGVWVDGTGTLVTSVSGNIGITGTGGDGSADLSDGVVVADGAQVTSTGTGTGAATITLQGTGGTGTDANYGVAIFAMGTLLTSVSGNIGITGTAGNGPSGINIGVLVDTGAHIASTGTATVTLQGTGGTGTSANYGVDVDGTGTLMTSASGAISLTATAGANSTALDLLSSAQITTTSAPITFTADSMSFDSTAVVSAPGNVVTLQPLTAGTQIDVGGGNAAGTLGLTAAELNIITAGAIHVGNSTAGAITVSAAVALTSTSTLELITGAGITETGSLTVTNLATTSAGAVALTQANTVSTLAGAVSGTGSFAFTNSGALTVGTVEGVAGITTTSGDVTLTTTGLLTIGTGAGESITAPGSTITLNAAGVTEVAGSAVSAANLLLEGNGTFTLAQAGNTVTTLAANTSGGPIVYENASALTVGTVNGTAGIVSASQNVTLCNLAGDQTLADAINAGTATTLLDSAGNVTQTAGTVTAGTLGVRADGNISMPDLNSAANVGLQAGGTIVYNSAGPFTITTVAASTCFRGASGVSNTGEDITLCQASGTLTVNSPLNAGPSGTIRLQSAGGVTQTAAGTLTAANLGVVASGDVTLDLANPNSLTGTFAAQDSGAGNVVRFADNTSGFTVGTVSAASCFAGATGVMTTNGNIVLEGAGLTLAQNVTAGSGTILLGVVTGGINQTGGSVTGASLFLGGAGTFTLNQAGNDVSTLAASVAGPLSYVNAGALTIDTVLGFPGITTTNGNLTLTVGGALTVNQPINVGTGTIAIMVTTGAAATFNPGATITAAAATIQGLAGSPPALDGNTLTLNYPADTAVVINGANQGTFSNTSISVPGGFAFAGFGTINTDGGNDSFTFANDNAALSGSLNAGLGNDTLSYSGYSAAMPVTITFDTSDATGFGGTSTGIGGRFSGIENFVGGAANDVINVGVTTVTSLAGTLTIDGGPNAATPVTTLTVNCPGMPPLSNSLPLGNTFNLNDQGNATAASYTLNATTLTTGNLTVDYSHVQTINLNAGTAGDTVSVAGTPASSNTTVNGGAGTATVTVSGTGAGSNTTVNGGTAGVNTLTVSGSGASAFVQLNAGPNGDTLNVTSTGTASVTEANGGAGDDTFNLGNGLLSAIQGTVCFHGNANVTTPTLITACPGAPSTLPNAGDVLNLNDQNSTTANTYSLGATTFAASSMPATFAYDTTETIVLNTGSGNNTVSVTGTPAGTNTTVNGSAGNDAVTVSGTGASSNTVVNGSGGINTLTVSGSGANAFVQLNAGPNGDTLNVTGTGTGSVTEGNGGAGDDTFNLGNGLLSGIQGTVCFHGNGNVTTPTLITACPVGPSTLPNAGDVLNLKDQNSTTANTYTLSATTFAATSMLATLTYDTTETVVLNTGSGNNAVSVTATPGGSNTTVNGSSGNDFVVVSSTGTSSNTVVNGAGGKNTLTVSGSGANAFVQLNAGPNGDTLNVLATGNASVTEANGGAGDDTFNLGNGLLSALHGTVCLHGAGNVTAPTLITVCPGGPIALPNAGNVLNLNDQASGTNNVYSLTATGFAASTLTAAFTYDTMQTITLNAGSGTNGLGVLSTAAGSNVTINGDSTATSSDNITVVSTGTGSNTVVNGGAGNDLLTLNGNGASSFVQLNGQAGANTLNVRGTALGSITGVNGGAGNDTMNVGGPGNLLDPIQGNVCVNGQGHAPAPTNTLSVSGSYQVNPYVAPGVATVANTLAVGDVLNLLDQGNLATATYALAPTTFQRLGTGLVTYTTIESVNLAAGSGNNTILVSGTADSVNTSIDTRLTPAAPGRSDTILVATTGNSSNVLILAGAASTTLTIGTTGTHSVTAFQGGLSGDTVIVNNSGLVSGLLLNGGPGADGFRVVRTGPGSVTALNGNGGNNNFYMGPSLSALGGLVTVSGGVGGLNGLGLDDSNEAFVTPGGPGVGAYLSRPLGGVLTYYTGTVMGPGNVPQTFHISYDDTIHIATLALTQGNDVFNISGTNTQLSCVYGMGGNDFMGVTATEGPTFLYGDGPGSSAPGNDTFSLGNNAAGLPASLDGGQIDGANGFNVLNYSSQFRGPSPELDATYNSPVLVNLSSAGLVGSMLMPDGQVLYPDNPGVFLPPHSATGTGGVANIQEVIGTRFDDLLVGSDAFPTRLEGRGGNDVLLGMSGGPTAQAPTVLIGGDITDRLFAMGSGFTVMYAGGNNTIAGAQADPTGFVADPNPADPPSTLVGGTGHNTFVINSGLELRLARVIVMLGPLGSGNQIVQVTNFQQMSGNLLTELPVPGPAAPPDPPPGVPGQNLSTVALDFLTSQEDRVNLLTGYYLRYLGRTPDSSGLTQFLGALASGASQEAVQAAILASPEYFARHGNTPEGFLLGLYQDLLGRSPTAAEISTWLAIYGRVGAGAVALGLLTGDEYRTDLINRWYVQYLGRPADPVGLSTALAQLRQGASQEQVQAGLLASSEYQQRVNDAFGGAGSSFIAGLYRDVLHRDPGPNELGVWIDHLEDD